MGIRVYDNYRSRARIFTQRRARGWICDHLGKFQVCRKNRIPLRHNYANYTDRRYRTHHCDLVRCRNQSDRYYSLPNWLFSHAVQYTCRAQLN
ncbi:hypothetical protein D3C75_859500 [compost metagenome]